MIRCMKFLLFKFLLLFCIFSCSFEEEKTQRKYNLKSFILESSRFEIAKDDLCTVFKQSLECLKCEKIVYISQDKINVEELDSTYFPPLIHHHIEFYLNKNGEIFVNNLEYSKKEAINIIREYFSIPPFKGKEVVKRNLILYLHKDTSCKNLELYFELLTKFRNFLTESKYDIEDKYIILRYPEEFYVVDDE